ncbi:macro domain-containing protein [Myroides sp. LJL116]
MDKAIKVLQGDISQVKAQIIVIGANTKLLPAKGVNEQIHQQAGKQVYLQSLQFLAKYPKIPIGFVVQTQAGNLDFKSIFHAVVPLYSAGHKDFEKLLALCYYNAMELCCAKGYKSIAFSSISTYCYGVDKRLAAQIALDTVREFLKDRCTKFEVLFVCADFENYVIYNELME